MRSCLLIPILWEWLTFSWGTTLADAVLDRLVDNANRLEMRGDSMRKSRGNRMDSGLAQAKELRLKEPMRRRVLLRVSAIVTFIAGAFGLWYGFAMSFLVPGTPGESYFRRDRILLGACHLVGSILALTAAGWIFFRSFSEPKITSERAITYCIGGAACLGFLDAVIGSLTYQR